VFDAIATLTHAARRRGFDVHPAPPAPPPEAQAEYLAWLKDGRHAGMAYLARDVAERLDPRRRFPWLQGVLVLSVSYAYPEPPKPAGGLRWGRVARYAWVRDYHAWIELHLRALEQLCARLGGRCKGYVDHGPVLERAYAAASGAGWIGRNGLWIPTAGGSYRHLAVLLTSWPTEAAPPHPNRCGSCTACVRHCPTGAIVADGVVDARRCLSYWTIEHRGLVPLELWPRWGEWIFGCDDCQTVCPWNRRFSSPAAPEPDPELAWPDLRSFFMLSNRGFARRYAGSAFVRSGRPALARNVLVAASGAAPEVIEALLPLALEDASTVVRATAAAVAARMGRADRAGEALRTLAGEAARYVEEALDLFA